MPKVFETFALESRSADKATIPLFGVECEIESVNREHTSWSSISGILTQDDHSLRNNGVEIVWRAPKNLEDSIKVFKTLHSKLVFYSRDEKFSERTSTHVHMNVRPLEITQLLTLLQLYILYEELFFLQADPSRRESIFCMPLTETHLPSVYHYRNVGDYYAKWSKYTALNLKRLVDLGTVEFRHLQGTDDVVLLTNWLTTLSNLYNLCQKVEISANTLKNPALIQEYADELFGHLPIYKYVRGNLLSHIEHSLLDLKLSFV